MVRVGRTALRWLLLALVALPACAGSGAQVHDVTTQVQDVTATTEGKAATRAAEGTAQWTGPPSTTTTAAPPATRSVVEQAWTPFATVGGVVLTHPSARVERVGFHESNHEGARHLVTLPTAASPVTMEARERGTGSQTAADVVIDPELEVRAPVSGRVKRAGTYVLYCRHSDDFVVIAPDQQPAWEVKVLHIDGVRVRSGQRVEAGVTVIAPRPTPLPFRSQVDELRTVDPAWPHVHIEVVDPSIRNLPSPGSGC